MVCVGLHAWEKLLIVRGIDFIVAHGCAFYGRHFGNFQAGFDFRLFFNKVEWMCSRVRR